MYTKSSTKHHRQKTKRSTTLHKPNLTPKDPHDFKQCKFYTTISECFSDTDNLLISFKKLINVLHPKFKQPDFVDSFLFILHKIKEVRIEEKEVEKDKMSLIEKESVNQNESVYGNERLTDNKEKLKINDENLQEDIKFKENKSEIAEENEKNLKENIKFTENKNKNAEENDEKEQEELKLAKNKNKNAEENDEKEQEELKLAKNKSEIIKEDEKITEIEGINEHITGSMNEIINETENNTESESVIERHTENKIVKNEKFTKTDSDIPKETEKDIQYLYSMHKKKIKLYETNILKLGLLRFLIQAMDGARYITKEYTDTCLEYLKILSNLKSDYISSKYKLSFIDNQNFFKNYLNSLIFMYQNITNNVVCFVRKQITQKYKVDMNEFMYPVNMLIVLGDMLRESKIKKGNFLYNKDVEVSSKKDLKGNSHLELEKAGKKNINGDLELETGKNNENNGRLELETGKNNDNNSNSELETRKNNDNNSNSELEIGKNNDNNGNLELETGKNNDNNSKLELKTGKNNDNNANLELKIVKNNENNDNSKLETGKNNDNNSNSELETGKNNENNSNSEFETGKNNENNDNLDSETSNDIKRNLEKPNKSTFYTKDDDLTPIMTNESYKIYETVSEMLNYSHLYPFRHTTIQYFKGLSSMFLSNHCFLMFMNCLYRIYKFKDKDNSTQKCDPTISKNCPDLEIVDGIFLSPFFVNFIERLNRYINCNLDTNQNNVNVSNSNWFGKLVLISNDEICDFFKRKMKEKMKCYERNKDEVKVKNPFEWFESDDKKLEVICGMIEDKREKMGVDYSSDVNKNGYLEDVEVDFDREMIIFLVKHNYKYKIEKKVDQVEEKTSELYEKTGEFEEKAGELNEKTDKFDQKTGKVEVNTKEFDQKTEKVEIKTKEFDENKVKMEINTEEDNKKAVKVDKNSENKTGNAENNSEITEKNSTEPLETINNTTDLHTKLKIIITNKNLLSTKGQIFHLTRSMEMTQTKNILKEKEKREKDKKEEQQRLINKQKDIKDKELEHQTKKDIKKQNEIDKQMSKKKEISMNIQKQKRKMKTDMNMNEGIFKRMYILFRLYSSKVYDVIENSYCDIFYDLRDRIKKNEDEKKWKESMRERECVMEMAEFIDSLVEKLDEKMEFNENDERRSLNVQNDRHESEYDHQRDIQQENSQGMHEFSRGFKKTENREYLTRQNIQDYSRGINRPENREDMPNKGIPDYKRGVNRPENRADISNQGMLDYRRGVDIPENREGVINQDNSDHRRGVTRFENREDMPNQGMHDHRRGVSRFENTTYSENRGDISTQNVPEFKRGLNRPENTSNQNISDHKRGGSGGINRDENKNMEEVQNSHDFKRAVNKRENTSYIENRRDDQNNNMNDYRRGVNKVENKNLHDSQNIPDHRRDINRPENMNNYENKTQEVNHNNLHYKRGVNKPENKTQETNQNIPDNRRRINNQDNLNTQNKPDYKRGFTDNEHRSTQYTPDFRRGTKIQTKNENEKTHSNLHQTDKNNETDSSSSFNLTKTRNEMIKGLKENEYKRNYNSNSDLKYEKRNIDNNRNTRTGFSNRECIKVVDSDGFETLKYKNTTNESKNINRLSENSDRKEFGSMEKESINENYSKRNTNKLESGNNDKKYGNVKENNIYSKETKPNEKINNDKKIDNINKENKNDNTNINTVLHTQNKNYKPSVGLNERNTPGLQLNSQNKTYQPSTTSNTNIKTINEPNKYKKFNEPKKDKENVKEMNLTEFISTIPQKKGTGKYVPPKYNLGMEDLGGNNLGGQNRSNYDFNRNSRRNSNNEFYGNNLSGQNRTYDFNRNSGQNSNNGFYTNNLGGQNKTYEYNRNSGQNSNNEFYTNNLAGQNKSYDFNRNSGENTNTFTSNDLGGQKNTFVSYNNSNYEINRNSSYNNNGDNEFSTFNSAGQKKSNLEFNRNSGQNKNNNSDYRYNKNRTENKDNPENNDNEEKKFARGVHLNRNKNQEDRK